MPDLKSDMKFSETFLGQFPLPPIIYNELRRGELPALLDRVQIYQQGDLVNCMQDLDSTTTDYCIMLPASPNQPLKN